MHGFMVRTLADSQTVEARENYTYRRDAVLTAGAHFVATDFVQLPPLFASNYSVSCLGWGEL